MRADVDSGGATRWAGIVWRSAQNDDFERCIPKIVRDIAHGPMQGPVLTDVSLRFVY